ncbi:TPA: hypothetical protein EYP26_00650 [Candidatus Bathyarchaeota archaeon]|nr:hypothetical protein [Candidatus Bathyarchaeota archaeon]
MKLKLRVENYNIDLTFKPSFLSSLYLSEGAGQWRKIAGHLAFRLRFKQADEKTLIVESEAGLKGEALYRRALLETGLYKGPYEYLIERLPGKVKPQVEALASVYSGVRLPHAPLDFKYIFVAASLSRRANYDTAVLNWCKKLWERFDGRLELIPELGEELTKVGTSYQVLQLPRIVKEFMELSTSKRLPNEVKDLIGKPYVPPEEFLLWLPPELARLTLIRCCWAVGPKVADSIILTTFKATSFVPCDAHARLVSIRLGLVNSEGLGMPEKRYCAKFLCEPQASATLRIPLCPKAKEGACLRAALTSLFKDLGGWIQTLIYLHGKKFCKSKRHYVGCVL